MNPLFIKLNPAFVTLAYMGWVPVWFAAIVIGRDLVIIGGTAYYHLRVAKLEGEPTGVSKLNTVFQILFILLTITNGASATITGDASIGLIAV